MNTSLDNLIFTCLHIAYERIQLTPGISYSAMMSG